MTILFLTHGADMMGANRSMLAILDGIRAHGVSPIVALPQAGSLEQALQARGIAYFITPYFNWAHTRYISRHYWLNAYYQRQNKTQHLPRLTAEAQQRQVDLVYTNSSITGMGAWLAEAIGVPHVWHIREFGEADYGLAFWKGKRAFRHGASKAQLVVAISHAVEKAVLDGIDAPKLTLYDGMVSRSDYARIPPNSHPPKDTFTFLIIGLIHPTKGQLTALRAFHQVYQEYPQARLIIAGKGRRLYTRSIQTYIRRHHLTEVVDFKGYVSDPEQVHQQADAVLVCSKKEGLGRVTVEGMLWGNPVIGYDSGGTAELIDHQETGLLYQNFEELVQYMGRLLTDPDAVRTYGANGRAKVPQHFFIQDYVDQLYQHLQPLLPKKTP